jgi:hypothetical protein
MNFSLKRMTIGAILVVAVLALFFIVRPKDSSDQENDNISESAAPALVTGATGAGSSQPANPKKLSPQPVPQVVVMGGEPQGGVVDLEFEQGDEIRFSVKSDIDEEIHVHGYDVSKPIKAGSQVTLKFPADITGIFEVELENSAVPIAELQVNP